VEESAAKPTIVLVHGAFADDFELRSCHAAYFP
jgi:hypothetical protein